MNYKKGNNHKGIKRKQGNNQPHSVGEWSRMIHSWWNKDVVAKFYFKKHKEQI